MWAEKNKPFQIIEKRDKGNATYVKDASKENDLVYRKLRSSVTREIRKAKRFYYDKKNRKRAQFKRNNELLQPFFWERNSKKQEVEVEKFNDFFVSFGKKLAFGCRDSLTHDGFVADGPFQTFALFNTVAAEVYSIIKQYEEQKFFRS